MYLKVGTVTQDPVYLRVLKEHADYWITVDMYAMGIMDESPRYSRKRQVRWSKHLLVRVGETETTGIFRVKLPEPVQLPDGATGIDPDPAAGNRY